MPTKNSTLTSTKYPNVDYELKFDFKNNKGDVKCPVCLKIRTTSYSNASQARRGDISGICHDCSHRKRKHTEEHKESLKITLRGANNPNWRGGKTDLKDRIRTNISYRQWRSDVFTRDKFTCQFCGQWGRRLHADHIKPFRDIIFEYSITTLEDAINCEELWNINNGRTLCETCHKKTETYGGKCKISK